MADSRYEIPGNLSSSTKRAVLEHRRCILLLVTGSTDSDNTALSDVISLGFLRIVKKWLDDITSRAVGDSDLLLHLINSVSGLPVSKSDVMSSGLGKAIGAVEKHSICVGAKNESAIKSSIKELKVNWNASVKQIRSKNASSKRTQQDSTQSLPAAKKAKTESDKSDSSKSVSQRVKWNDHFGGPLEDAQQISNERKRIDLNDEMDILAKAKRSKLAEYDEQDDFGVRPSTTWKGLMPLTFRASQVPRINSSEVGVQNKRCASVQRVQYYSDADVPRNPTPMTPVQEAMDLAAHAQTSVGALPFFNPQKPPSPPHVSAQRTSPPLQPQVSLPPHAIVQHSSPPLQPQVPTIATRSPSPPQHLLAAQRTMSPQTYQAPAPAPSAQYQQQQILPGLAVGASAETVQAMGLPLFLVGSDIQALQTLSQTPGLLNTFIDNNGVYDEPRILELVQNLSQNQGHSQSSSQEQLQQKSQQGKYYQAQRSRSNFQNQNQYRGEQNGTEANLHVSGYGPSTTKQDIVVLFSQYVRIDEIVMKNGFTFVNTSDPEGAKHAKAALNGALLGGSPIRIIVAQRRKRGGSDANLQGLFNNKSNGVQKERIPLPINSYGQIDYDQVRDDRGNAATKNLFVAGYGAGTSEQQLREVFSQFTTVTGCVMKGSFSFVNTTDKASAVNAREALTGTILNGGSLRISFAKETGRLGTSFDSTYGANTRSPYMRNPVYSSNNVNDNMNSYSFRPNM